MNFEHTYFNVIKKILAYKNSPVIPQTNFLFNIIFKFSNFTYQINNLTNYQEISKLKLNKSIIS